MNKHEIDLNSPEDIFANLDVLTAQAQKARAEAIGELVKSGIAAIRQLVNKTVAWNARRVASAQLMNLDDRMLADIGIGRGDIQSSIEGIMEKGAANSNDQGRHAA
ncbi:MAG: DUF1127 domain-containing protein [Alphaproteobacteria bacterium]|nr:DUF1127 domain-containing protein [Alphaproteobacteria bacterium]MBT4086526.1 DUF1127 domain-containing protein [Alphaproteobacteria bacterium]MBT4545340.1 DUF1127 domain-containing protein [Alphaproteobacteria bacterium]MBT7745358.1 DUF1127 domain-containing protein [Alphaproteobacteria bacterium]